MRQSSVPLTGEELVTIGNIVIDVERRLRTLQDGGAGDELMDGVEDVVVTILRPDGIEEAVGEVRWYHEGWFGFYPHLVSE